MTQSDTQIAGSAPRAGASPAPGSATAPAARARQNQAAAPPEPERRNGLAEELVEEDLLVEDVSIDGMCGVY